VTPTTKAMKHVDREERAKVLVKILIDLILTDESKFRTIYVKDSESYVKDVQMKAWKWMS
jgi:hypothetical protein